MIVYTAGPYAESCGVGTVGENIARAREIALKLWDMGYTVICPHLNTAHFEQELSLTNKDFVDRDLEIVERCDAIIMLPYWESSRGAARELSHARRNEIPYYIWPRTPDEGKAHKLVLKGVRRR